MIVLDQPHQIEAARLLALRAAARLECKGMKHSSGKSMVQVIRKEFGLKGNKQQVVDAFTAILRERKILL